MDINTKIQNLYERFYNQAMYMLNETRPTRKQMCLCPIKDTALAIVSDAVYLIKKEYKQLSPDTDFLKWAIDIFKKKMDYQLLLEDAIAGSKKAENSYFTMLHNRLLETAYTRNWDKSLIPEDIVQETIQKIFKRYKTLNKPLIPFSQLELNQTVKTILSKKKVTLVISTDENDTEYENEEESPIDKVHYDLLKKRLLSSLNKWNSNYCKILEVYLSGGGRKELVELWPEMNTNTLDTWLFRFRQVLKEELHLLRESYN